MIERLLLILRLLNAILFLLVIAFAASIYGIYFHDSFSTIDELSEAESKPLPSATEEIDSILADDPNLEVIQQNCTACHSARLIVQNRATREGWQSMIEWMQATQNLWDLGQNEEIILDYLVKNYAPESKGRRANLESIEWYRLTE